MVAWYWLIVVTLLAGSLGLLLMAGLCAAGRADERQELTLGAGGGRSESAGDAGLMTGRGHVTVQLSPGRFQRVKGEAVEN